MRSYAVAEARVHRRLRNSQEQTVGFRLTMSTLRRASALLFHLLYFINIIKLIKEVIMLKFNQFISIPTGYSDLIEELNDAQKKVVDSWKGAGDRARQISGHVFAAGQDRMTVPFDAPQAPLEPHPDIKAHLEKHGYGVSDY